MEESTVESDSACAQSVYHIKWISWNSVKTPIITQNVNGPCPLLAIFNVLLLSRRVTLPETLEMISSKQMIDYIGGLLFESMPEDLIEGERLNFEQNMSDAMSVFPKLQTGIDVNIKFVEVSCFECTPELAVFDVLRIPLYHGWLPDPQDNATCSSVMNYSYNQLVEKIISSKDSTDEDVLREGLLAEEFLKNSASQLTCHGVLSILESAPNHRLAVLFRNNHFLTLYKKENELFTLVTDQGFLTKNGIVWETLSSVQGDTNFTDADFHSSQTQSHEQSPEQQLDSDFQIAMSLQNEEDKITPCQNNPSTANTSHLSNEDKDRQMATKLQQELDKEALRHSSSRAPPRGQPPQTVADTEDKKCIIL